MIFNEADVSEEIAAVHKSRNPYRSADNIVSDEFRVSHASDARDEGREGSDYGNEPGYNYCLPAIFFVKAVCAFQVFLLKEADFLFVKYLGSDGMAYPVVHRIAQYGGNRKHKEKVMNVERSFGCECAGREQKRIAGEKRRYNEPGFPEDYEKKQYVGSRSVLGDKLAQMHVKMQE
jgi:hypothetical protein